MDFESMCRGFESLRARICWWGLQNRRRLHPKPRLDIPRRSSSAAKTCGCFSGAALCVAIFGGDGEASRVARNFKAVATVGADSDLLRGIDGRPYPCRGDDVALCGVGGTGWGNDFAAYGGGDGGVIGTVRLIFDRIATGIQQQCCRCQNQLKLSYISSDSTKSIFTLFS